MEEHGPFVGEHKGKKQKLWAWGISESREDRRGYGTMAQETKRGRETADGLDKDIKIMKGTEDPEGSIYI